MPRGPVFLTAGHVRRRLCGMHENLGAALSGFDAALQQLRVALAPDPVLREAVFKNTEDWSSLLSFKLVPHLAGDGCLIAAVAGGTNTGKSTVFNLLLGRAVSPVVATAAATRHPVLAANPQRAAQCLEGKLVPEFQPVMLDDAAAVVGGDADDGVLFVSVQETLPSRLVLLDTPDVDSIDTRNWKVADHIRAAGDVLVAVLTGEKYKDERVVAFFRHALASGRVVLPLMNKANPANDFAVARRQLDEFASDVGTGAPRFVLPHDFDLENAFTRPVPALDGGPDLRSYLESVDVPQLKQRVYRATVSHFAHRAGTFLDDLDELGAALRSAVDEFEARTASFAGRYDPAPGAQVGGLFHEFVQSKRGFVRRTIGTTSTAAFKALGAVGRGVAGAFRKRATLEADKAPATDAEIRALHAKTIERITRDLARSFVESGRNLREPAAHLVRDRLDRLDLEAIVEAVTAQTLTSENISQEFRAHANRMLESWWNDHKGRRRALEALDTILALVPTAIAAPLAIYAAGVGVTETVIVVGPVVEQFVARVLEYQFGDAMFDFLSPWRDEQRRNFETALLEHLVAPCLEETRRYLEILQGPMVEDLRKWQTQCLTTS